MDKHHKAQKIETVLFSFLLAVFGAAGFVYERFRDQMPRGQLVAIIIAGMCVAFIGYRLALKVMHRER